MHNVGHERRLVCSVACVWLAAVLCADAAPTPRNIPEQAVQEFRDDLSETYEIESTSTRRMATKRVVRRALSFLEEHPDAPNRFKLLGLVFQGQKNLLLLRNDERNRDAILETCRKLLEAPYEYANERLEADILLMQLALDEKGATEYEQAVAIADLADRYRGTPAEVDSLIVGAEQAFNLGQVELLQAFRSTLARRFRQDPQAIGFLKERFASHQSSLPFRGRFERLDGETLVLPMDRAGHVYLACFWSSQLTDMKQRLLEVKALQEKYPGSFEVFSFNLDQLPDAGKATLDALGLDWIPMRLPSGGEHPLFQACGTDSQFLTRIVNLNGYVILTPTTSVPNRFGRVFDLEAYLNITRDRPQYLAMAQTMRIGEFLVWGESESGDGGLPAEKMDAIQSCFAVPLPRYRLFGQEALKNFVRADKLCKELVEQHPKAATLWKVRNRRIVALLGQWNLAGEPRHLREAATVARDALAANPPGEGRLVPRFCLAKVALREEDADADAVMSDFIEAAGGEEASGAAVAAALVLSLDAVSPVRFEEYRERLLDGHMDDAQLWPVVACFFDKFVVGRLFRGNHYGSDVRVYAGFRSWQEDTEERPRHFRLEMKSLDGEAVEFPHPDKDKTNVAIVMDLPADETSAGIQLDFMKRLEQLSSTHFHTNVHYVAAFLSEDANAVRALARRNQWKRERLALVKDGVRNPDVARLGILLPDERPNTFVVAPDGTVLWGMSGMYQMSVGAGAVMRTVGNMVRRYDLRIAQSALESGDFLKALRYFSGSFPPERFNPAPNSSEQIMGRGRAHIGLGQWQAALEEFDSMVTEHTKNACQEPCACRSLSRKLEARAGILDNLGEDDRAAADRGRAQRLACPREGKTRFHPDRYEQEFFNRLQGLTQKNDWQAALDYVDEVIVHGKDGRQKEREVFAGLLREYARALTQSENKAKAEECHRWADALTVGIEVKPDDSDFQRERRYVDLVEE